MCSDELRSTFLSNCDEADTRVKASINHQNRHYIYILLYAGLILFNILVLILLCFKFSLIEAPKFPKNSFLGLAKKRWHCILFDKFWSCVWLFERLGNVYAIRAGHLHLFYYIPFSALIPSPNFQMIYFQLFYQICPDFGPFSRLIYSRTYLQKHI
jgi:hypothetical protein